MNDSQSILVGQYNRKLNTSGQIKLPKDWLPFFRNAGATHLHLFAVENSHLVVMPAGRKELEVDHLKSALKEAQSSGPPQDEFVTAARNIIETGTNAAIAPDGSITIPDALLQRAHLGTRILFVGCMDCAEIWDPARFEEDSKNDAGNLGDAAVDLGL